MTAHSLIRCLENGDHYRPRIEPSPPNVSATWVFDNPQPLDPASFPHQPRQGGTQIPSTIANVQHLLSSYGITVRYNVVRKKLMIHVPGYSGAPDNADNVGEGRLFAINILYAVRPSGCRL